MFSTIVIVIVSLIGLVVLCTLGIWLFLAGAFIAHDVKTKMEKTGPYPTKPDNSPPPPRIEVPPGGFRPPPMNPRPSFPATNPAVKPDEGQNK